MRPGTGFLGNFMRKSRELCQLAKCHKTEEDEEIRATERARRLLAGEVATEHDMRDIITKMVEANGTKSAVAVTLDVSSAYLGDILLGRRSVGGKIVKKLGWEKVVVYRRK